MFVFFLAYPFLSIITRLPFPALYSLSNLLYLVVYKWFGYRKKVVFQNLKNAFPTKTDAEITTIAENFYRYLCDLILETIKKINMTKEESNERCIYHLTPDVAKLVAEKKSLILLMGHQGNWEWAGSGFTLTAGTQLYAVYKPLSNSYFEKWMVKSRTMFGTRLIKMENTLRDILGTRNSPGAYAFIADQTPLPPVSHWLPFLHQETAVFTGAEKLARKLNYPVLFINIKRMKRGYYEIFTELMTENPKDMAEHEITEAYFRLLEKEIVAMPETWLWSHRRWKLQR